MKPDKYPAITFSVVFIAALLFACSGPAAAPTLSPLSQAAVPTPAASAATTAVKVTEAAPNVAAAAAAAGASAEGAVSKGLTCLADAYNGKMKGAKVSMTGPFSGSDAAKFDSSMKEFEDATGITIEYRVSGAEVPGRVQRRRAGVGQIRLGTRRGW